MQIIPVFPKIEKYSNIIPCSNIKETLEIDIVHVKMTSKPDPGNKKSKGCTSFDS
uniref:Uncharacterized protein n=1 Tax=Rhizophora mucronata TaxID=61149 RepID=A0A2P2NRI5_RHIMU